MVGKSISTERKDDLLAEIRRQKTLMARLNCTLDSPAVSTEIKFAEPAALVIREELFFTDRVQMKAEVMFDEYYFFMKCAGKKDMLSEVVRVSEITENAESAIRLGMAMLCAEMMSPDVLHNKALRYLELGCYEKAERLLRQAIMKDGSRFLYHYSWALQRWNRHLMSDAAFAGYLRQHADHTSFCRDTLALVAQIRGTPVEYTLPKQGNCARPDCSDPIHPVTDVSNDGRFRVIGYQMHNADGKERYGFRIEDLQIGEVILDVPNDYADFGESTRHDGFTYLHAHYYKSDAVNFAGTHSELIVMAADVLWIFDKSGRLIRSIEPIFDGDGNTCSYSVLGYTDSGEIVYQFIDRTEYVRAIRVQPQIDLPFRTAEAAPIEQRLQGLIDLQNTYEEALRCRDRKDYAGMYRTLKKSLDAGALTLHEPLLRLWSELSTHYPRSKLITVVETSDTPTPIPPRNERTDKLFSKRSENENKADNGQTSVQLSFDVESDYDYCTDAFQYDYTYNLTATDTLSGHEYYTVHAVERACEADWRPFSEHRYVGLAGDHLLLLAREESDQVKEIDLLQLSVDKAQYGSDGASRVRFALPGDYELNNTKEGVDIGGFVFQDEEFTDFRPLFASDVIACRRKNYRLIYSYDVR